MNFLADLLSRLMLDLVWLVIGAALVALACVFPVLWLVYAWLLFFPEKTRQEELREELNKIMDERKM